MEVVLTGRQLQKLIAETAKQAVNEFLHSIDFPVMVSKTTAYRRYGRNNVERWINDGDVKFKRNGKKGTSTCECSLFELEKQHNKEQFETKYYENQDNQD
ncbi:MAG: hypothetical protein J6034_06855 [Bacteroidaceae bacterium]|nr:hypothetical protein [Bacteroidaceae bacterium]